MNSMDSFRERIEALEQQMKVMGAHTRTVERRLRWWRGLACGVMVLGLLSGALPSGKMVDAQQGGLPARVAALEDKLVAVTFNSADHELVITGANLRIVNGLGNTVTLNGLGNLIVGYNELRQSFPDCQSAPTDPFCTDTRTGSHNVVVGSRQNFSKIGGLVVGDWNEISGDFAAVTGGQQNTASGTAAAVCGGQQNTASAAESSVSGGLQNTASAAAASVSGGQLNIASGPFASVSGGIFNTASGIRASVSGGRDRTASGEDDWAAGPLFADH